MPKASGPYAPPPFEQVGADGRQYFKVMDGVVGLQAAWQQGFRLLSELRTINHPSARVKVRLLTKHLAEMEKKIKAAEFLVAQETDNFVRARIKSTQVRPDNPHGPKLIGAIESRPIRYPLLPALAVGAVDIEILSKATTRPGANKPYWRSQEFGSTHLVGRTLTGFFQPGNAAPNPSQFRNHPLFEANSQGKLMRVQRPIEERAFLQSGVMQGALFRRKIWRDIELQALREVRQIVTAGAPIRRRKR